MANNKFNTTTQKKISNSNKAFKKGIIELILILVLIILTQFLNTTTSNFASILIGFLTLAIGIVAIIGFIFAVKAIKEPKTTKKIIGITFNFSVLILLIVVIISNAFDVYKAIY